MKLHEGKRDREEGRPNKTTLGAVLATWLVPAAKRQRTHQVGHVRIPTDQPTFRQGLSLCRMEVISPR